jgi:CheY-like chemotaxis protein
MEAVGQLTGGIAHDFNNMLTAILGSVELLEVRKAMFAPGAIRMLGVIRHAAERGANLTRGLLAFSRKQSLAPSVIDINQLVSDMSELLRRSLGESITIETALAGELWPAFIDPHQVESALLNLAVNARDAMPRGGTLKIETGNVVLNEAYVRLRDDMAAGEYLFVAVSDTGTGMTPDVLKRAFEPFFTTKAVGQGTGLGLSQVYGFVKQSGGNIELFSQAGRGTTVRMYFPRTNSRTAFAAPPLRASADPLPSGRETVLEAANAAEAMEILASRSDIQLLFTDLGLPGMNGGELATEALRLRPALKVVFTSAYARSTIGTLELPEREVHLLPKPFRIESLAQILRSVLDAI